MLAATISHTNMAFSIDELFDIALTSWLLKTNSIMKTNLLYIVD